MPHLLKTVLAGLCVCQITRLCLAAPEDPGFYVRKSDWRQSLFASLEAIAKSGMADGFVPFESGTMRGGDAARHISVPLGNAQELYLVVTGVPDVKWAVADWADARLVRPDGAAESLTKSTNFTVLLGRWERDLTLKSGLYQKMRLNDRTFERGVNVQADSIIRVPLDGTYARFEATIGVDDWAGTNGTVRFSVLSARRGAGQRLWVPLMRDFATGKDRQEMNWEIEDRIFEFDWRPGEWRALAQRYAKASGRVPPLAKQAAEIAAGVRDQRGQESLRASCYLRSRMLGEALARARGFDFAALGAAVEDLATSFPGKYPQENLARLAGRRQNLTKALAAFQPEQLETWIAIEKAAAEIEEFQRDALLANPLLGFEQLLVLRRVPLGGARRTSWEGFGYGEYLGIPRQSSWNYGTMPNVVGWTNEIAVLSSVRTNGELTTLFKPAGTPLVNDIELHWDADKLLFSMPDTNRNWQVHELTLDASPVGTRSTASLSSTKSGTQWNASLPAVKTIRQLTPSVHRDVHNYDGTYLPNDEILFLSTAPLQGVPCNAGVIVGMMYKMGTNGERIRQLTFEQDHDYTPSVLNNGRVLYLRWDYTDTPHVWNRLLMSMNPDGTGQMEYTGGNSYWPNAMFFARAIPNHPTKIVTIVTGHHEGRVGELFIFDPAKGRHETEGVVQRIPRKGPPVTAKIEDKLTEHSWPKFLHPWPLSDKYFLVACKPNPNALWGIYLVDVFDNLTLIKEEEGVALLEPVPLAKRPKPPVIQDKVQPANKEALVYMEDVYSGPGLKGVPRGTVKSLRLFTYHFGYQKLAGIDHRVGADGPWEAKRVLGTVPVESDGSALFLVPAKTPLSFQPLDAEGKAVALMRSWMSALPGENVSCVGCHDRQSGAPPGATKRIALTGPVNRIKPWRGPVRGFSFIHDVQPVLDKYCVGCHDGSAGSGATFQVATVQQPSRLQQDSASRMLAETPAGFKPAPQAPGLHAAPDLRREQGGYVAYRGGQLDGQFLRADKKDLLGRYGAVFDPSYVALRQFVRVGGLESDLHLLPPREFGADTSELIQMLAKGHHNVKLDAEAWDRLITWIDLNAPCHGTWSEVTKIPGDQCNRRLELRKLYGGIVENFEDEPDLDTDFDLPKPVIPEAEAPRNVGALKVDSWPFSVTEAKSRQTALGPVTRTVDLGGGIKMEFTRIPAGVFIMGDTNGAPDERNLAAQKIDKPFWMAKCEISNEQFAKFDPAHDSRFEHRTSWQFDEEYIGWRLNRPKQPVVRVSWEEATAFCRWLSQKLGEEVTLPTEAQWEWACRTGTTTPMNYGDLDTDFSKFGNMGDANLRKLADEGWRPKSPDLVPKDSRFDDGALVTTEVGRYAPNAWGLHDMHGNAAEWTRSDYGTGAKKVIRGGSWRDRPKLCRSASRWAYDPWQKIFNVGFRVIIDPNAKRLAAKE